MTERIIVPTANQEGINAQIAEHFGRAPYYTIVDLDKGETVNVKTVTNTSEHVGGTGSAHDQINELQPNVLIAYGMGPRGLITFQTNGIKVLKANADTVKAVIAAYKEGKLDELKDGCPHAHHH